MLVRGHSATAWLLSLLSFLFTPAIARFPETPAFASISPVASNAALTCDRVAIDRDSYELATIGQASALLSDRSSFWDAFRVNNHIAALRNLNFAVYDLADKALELDRRNMMAHSILARQYTILGWEREAADSWTRVVDNGGVVVWTATLYDVDYKSYFLMSFGRDAIRIYRMGQFAQAIDRHLGYAKFPQPNEIGFYEAAGGCPDPSVAPAAVIPWSDVKELRSGNWVVWFKLSRPVTVMSDRGKKETLRELKVNLHGETGEVKILAEPNPEYDGDLEAEPWKNVRGIGLGPWDYHRRVRDMLLRFAEPSAHIKRTSAGKGAGW